MKRGEKSRTNLVGNVAMEIDGQCHVDVLLSDEIAKLFATLEFVLSEPFLEQLLAALLQDGSAQLERLVLVQLALVEQYVEILQERRCLARLCGTLLELLDRLRRAQNALNSKSVEICQRAGKDRGRTCGALAATLAASE